MASRDSSVNTWDRETVASTHGIKKESSVNTWNGSDEKNRMAGSLLKRTWFLAGLFCKIDKIIQGAYSSSCFDATFLLDREGT